MTSSQLPRPYPRLTFGARLRIGFGIVVWPIVACCLIASAAFLLDAGQSQRSDMPSLQSLFVVYVAGGLAAGFLIALFQPLTRFAVGRVFVAGISAFPVSMLVMLMVENWRWRQISGADVGIAIGLALVFGPFAMAYARIRLGGESPISNV